MSSQPSQEARAALDTIATSSSSKEIVDAISAAFYAKAMTKVEDMKKNMSDDVFKNARKPEEMKYVKTALSKGAKDAEAQRQNDQLLATGQHAAGGLEPATQYKGDGVGAAGWMNPKSSKVPSKGWGGDRRPNRPGAPDYPFDGGTVPNGSGV